MTKRLISIDTDLDPTLQFPVPVVDEIEALATNLDVANNLLFNVGSLRHAPNNRVTTIGDNLGVGGAVNGTARLGDSWPNRITVESFQRIQFHSFYATDGYTLENIRDIHLPEVLALEDKPGACFIQGGMHDCRAGIDGGAFLLEDIVVIWKEMAEALLQANIVPIAVTVTPEDSSVNINQNVIWYNTWLRNYSATHGFPMVDAYDAVEGLDGKWKSGYSDDGTYPNGVGVAAIAAGALADELEDIFPPGNSRRTSRSVNDLTNIFNNTTINLGVFTTDAVATGGQTAADGVADGLALTGSGATAARVAPISDDDLKGYWQQLTRTAGATGTAFLDTAAFTGDFNPGEIVRFACRVQTENISTTGTPWTVCLFMDGTLDADHEQWGIVTWDADCADGMLSVQYQVPDGTTGLYWAMILGPNPGVIDAKLRVGEVTMRNLTTGGSML